MDERILENLIKQHNQSTVDLKPMGACLSRLLGREAPLELRFTSIMGNSGGRKKQQPKQVVSRDSHEATVKAVSARMKALRERQEAAMREIVANSFAHQFYQDAPNDVFELIVSLFSIIDEKGEGKGGLNVLKLVDKRFKRAVDAVATRLTQLGNQTSLIAPLPVAALKRCKGIQLVRADGYSLKQVEGLPIGLRTLIICNARCLPTLDILSACPRLETLDLGYAPSIKDLSPLMVCKRLKRLAIGYSGIVDVSLLPSFSFLVDLSIGKGGSGASIKDIVPISECKALKKIDLRGNHEITSKDLSLLRKCLDLEELVLWSMSQIKEVSFLNEGFAKLRVLNIGYAKVESLSPLMRLPNLEELDCQGLPPTTSLLPLASCHKLKMARSSENSKDLIELRAIAPELKVLMPITEMQRQ